MSNGLHPLFEAISNSIHAIEEIKEKKGFLDDWNDAGISKLARYVVHRKATLDLLEERRGRKDDEKYRLEDAIHEIVFPLKKTTEDVRIENMNLWIIDEELYDPILADLLGWDNENAYKNKAKQLHLQYRRGMFGIS